MTKAVGSFTAETRRQLPEADRDDGITPTIPSA